MPGRRIATAVPNLTVVAPLSQMVRTKDAKIAAKVCAHSRLRLTVHLKTARLHQAYARKRGHKHYMAWRVNPYGGVWKWKGSVVAYRRRGRSGFRAAVTLCLK